MLEWNMKIYLELIAYILYGKVKDQKFCQK